MKDKNIEGVERMEGKERHSREDVGLEKETPVKEKELTKDGPDLKKEPEIVKEKGEKNLDEITITDKEKSIDEIIDSAKLKRSLDKIKSHMGKEEKSEIKFGQNKLEVIRDKDDFKYKLNGKEVNEKDLQRFLEKEKERPVTKDFIDAAKKEKERLMEKEFARARAVSEHTYNRDSFRRNEIDGNERGESGSEKYDDLREREDAALDAAR